MWFVQQANHGALLQPLWWLGASQSAAACSGARAGQGLALHTLEVAAAHCPEHSPALKRPPLSPSMQCTLCKAYWVCRAWRCPFSSRMTWGWSRPRWAKGGREGACSGSGRDERVWMQQQRRQPQLTHTLQTCVASESGVLCLACVLLCLQVAVLTGLAGLPWVVKPLYGFISDSIPLFGYRCVCAGMFAGMLNECPVATTPNSTAVAGCAHQPAELSSCSTTTQSSCASCSVVSCVFHTCCLQEAELPAAVWSGR